MYTISLSGVDGVGKSSQIQLIKKYLHNKSIKTEIVHLFSHKSTVLLKLQSYSHLSTTIRKIRQLKTHKIGQYINISSRLLNVLLDSYLTNIYIKIYKKNKVLLFDRYFYDVLVMIIYDFPVYENMLLSFSKLIKKPDFAFILTGQPEQLIERKNGLSLTKVKRINYIYKNLAKTLGLEVYNSSQPTNLINKKIITSLNY